MRIQDCIFFQLTKAAQSGTRFWAGCVAEYSVTPAQAMVINFLGYEDRITARELGMRTSLDPATLTGVIDRLEAAGHLRRKPHPEDRRAQLIVLTRAGKTLAENLFNRMVRANSQFLQPLDEPERQMLKKLLKILRQNAHENMAPNKINREEP